MEKTTPEKSVFMEVTNGVIEPGKADVIVSLSIKTHLAGFYLLEPGGSLHGKPGYPLIFTIDGQAVVWREDGHTEVTPQYGEDGRPTPEGGEGRRYVFQKRLRLAPGRHTVEVDLPQERYACAFEMTVEAGKEAYFLELVPSYLTLHARRPTFLHGVGRIDPYLDSVPLPLTNG
jgi:hypothetical protein